MSTSQDNWENSDFFVTYPKIVEWLAGQRIPPAMYHPGVVGLVVSQSE